MFPTVKAPTPEHSEWHECATRVELWGHAVQLQADRAVSRSVGHLSLQVDMFQFVNALRQLRRAVEASREYDPSRIDLVLNAYGAASPGPADAPDIIEHFDEYALRGSGTHNCDEAGCPTELGYHLPEWFWSDGTTVGIHLGPYRLDVATAVTAAQAMAKETLNVLSAIGPH